MINSKTKLSNRVLAFVLSLLMLVSMMPVGLFVSAEGESSNPYSLTTDINEKSFVVNEYSEFTFTTHNTGSSNPMVLGSFEFSDPTVLVDLQYKNESTNNEWQSFTGDFGPAATGFPLTDNVTSTFRAKFNKPGKYSVVAKMKEFGTGNSLCDVTADVAVYSTSKLTTTMEDEFFIGREKQFTFTTTANTDKNVMVLGSFEFLDASGTDARDAVESLKYLEVQTGNWYEFYGDFGPAATGFPMDDATSTFKVTFKTAGTYTVNASMKTFADGTVLCATSKDIVVKTPVDLSTNIDSQSFYAGHSTDFEFTTTANDEAGKMVFGRFEIKDAEGNNAIDDLKLEYLESKDGNWYEFKGDFGPVGTGFPIIDGTSKFRATINKTGAYKIVVSLITDDKTTVLCAKEYTIVVNEPLTITDVTATSKDKTDKFIYTSGKLFTLNELIEVNGIKAGDTVLYSNSGIDDSYVVAENFKLIDNPSVTATPAGNYNIFVKIQRKYHNDLILKVSITVEKAKVQIAFDENLADITYKENNKFTYEVPADKIIATGYKGETFKAEGLTVIYTKDNDNDGYTVSENGQVEFTKIGEVSVKATLNDNANYDVTAAEDTYTVNIKYVDAPSFFVTAPVFTSNGIAWHREKVSIYEVDDENNWSIIESSNALGQTKWDSSIVKEEQGVYADVKVAFKNTTTGEITDLVAVNPFNIDKSAPTVSKVVFSQVNTSTFTKTINFLTFGLFFNQTLKVTILSEDTLSPGVEGSGIESYALTFIDSKGKKVEFNTTQTNNEFVVDYSEVKNFKGSLKVTLLDKAGNDDTYDVTTKNSNLTDTTFMLENTAPDIGIIGNADNKIHKNNFEFKIEAKDSFSNEHCSGINAVEVAINGTKVFTEITADQKGLTQYVDFALPVDIATKNVNGTFIENWNKGKLDITVVVYDNAGNYAEKSSTAYIDQTSPVISGFEFSLTDNIDVEKNTNGLYESVTLEDYGFYFKDNVTVDIYAEDILGENETVTSNVKEIAYAIINSENQIIEEGIKEIDANGKISVDIAADFKGQIYAMATDNVGNSPIDCVTCTDKNIITDDKIVDTLNLKGYSHPAGTISETEAGHNSEADHIVFSFTDINGDELTNNDLKLNNNLIFASDVYLNVNVKDKFSGIRKVEWFVTYEGKPELNYSNALEITNTGDFKYADAEKEADWTLTEKDFNLATKINNTLVFKNDSNIINVTLKLTDRSGNTSEDKIAFAIDKTKPVITGVVADKLEWTKETIKFTVSAEDKDGTLAGSGIVYYSMDSCDENAAWQESNVFEINDANEHTFYAKDAAGLISEVTNLCKLTASNYDAKVPQITGVTLNPPTHKDDQSINWYKETIYATVTAIDERDVTPEGFINHENSGVEFYSMDKCGDDAEWQTSNVFPINDNNEHTFYVKDRAGNISAITDACKATAIHYDNRDVDLTFVTFDAHNTNALADLINFLSFGYFFNENVTVTVDAVDNSDGKNSASGIATYELFFYTYEEDVQTLVYHTGAQNSNVFTLNANDIKNFKGKIELEIIDNANNTTEHIAINSINSNLVAFDEIMLENDAPVIGEIVNANEIIHKNDFSFTFNVNDFVTDKEVSGISFVQVSVNGTIVLEDDLSESYDYTEDYVLPVVSADKTVNGVTIDNWNKAKLDIKVIAYDNSGNYSEKSSIAYFDQTTPVITGFDFSLENYIDVEKAEDELYKSITVEDYGFYFKEDVVVTITAADLIGKDAEDADLETVVSGVSSITYKAIDIDGTVKYEGTDVAVDEKGQIKFTISKDDNFKGQIYAYATDNVGNKPTDCVTCNDSNVILTGELEGYVHPNGSIVESQAKHDSEADHIIFETPETSYTQNDNTALYSGDTPVTITVKDTYSGIRNVEWAVTSKQDIKNNYSGSLTIANDGKTITYSEGSEETDWVILEAQNDRNLATIISNVINVANNSNDITVYVKITDRAGNTSEKSIIFGIDKTVPTIEVTYDNNEPDEQYTDIYDADRTATVVITERNFRAKDVVFTITSTDGIIPTIDLTSEAAWQTVNNEDPDKIAHVATFTYAADGDYTFDISYKDNANNNAAQFDQHKFTIDKTIPTVTVEYDNNSAKNGNYYKAQRTATITIFEHNFDAARVNVIGIASDNAVPQAFPATSTWISEGDVHKATILYAEDSKYTFDIEFLDMAGNSIEDFAQQEFYVDKTNPTISISGIVDESANNNDGNIGFVITATDTNFDTFSPTLSAVIKTENGFETQTFDIGRFATITNGKTYTVTNIDTDGIYSITCTSIDKAGNAYSQVILYDKDGSSYVAKRDASSKLITFSVNRDGSTFDLDSYTKNLVDTYYVKNVTENLTIIEINADQIVEKEITVNGKVLTEGTDYTVVLDNTQTWHKYSYVLNKNLFTEQGEYNIIVTSKDKAENTAFSDVKELNVKFVVDRTAPVITVSGLKTNGRYNTTKQLVTLIPTDDGGLIKTLIVRTVDKDGNVIDEILRLSEKELLDAVAAGSISFELNEKGSYQYVQIICEDMAGNIIGDTTEEIIRNVTVTTNQFLLFWANQVYRYSAIGALILIAAAIVFIIVLKKRKEKDETKAK